MYWMNVRTQLDFAFHARVTHIKSTKIYYIPSTQPVHKAAKACSHCQ